MQHLQADTTLQGGKYKIKQLLGQGGFGNTYAGIINVFNERVAIKEFFMQGINDRDVSTGSVTISLERNKHQFQEQLEKFKKEALRIRQLKNEHIVTVHDLFEENGTVYYVMDYVDGENLAERLKRTGKPMTEQEVRGILPQILDALKTVHNAGIWHLDLKPANIMLDKVGNVKLIDFGASKQFNAQKGGATTSTAISYTNGYAPREQMEQNYDKFGPWTDIYALGATLYNLLTNKRPPLPTDLDDDLTEDKQDALPFPLNIGCTMKKLVLWMMNTNLRQRPQKVEEITSFINSYFDENTILPDSIKKGNTIDESPKASVNNKKRRLLKFMRILLACACILALILLGWGIYDKNHESIEFGFEEKENDPTMNFIPLEAKKGNLKTIVQNIIDNMVMVEGGSFIMGATSEQINDAWEDEYPTHKVTLSSFYIGKFEVTQEEWNTVMNDDRVVFEGDNKPIADVSWNSCQEFIKKLNAISHHNFRLPTEAEWEYAARGGRKSQGKKYSGSNNLESVGWSRDNCGRRVHSVGELQPNELGIYDMSGNVSEFCQDWYAEYSKQNMTNPQGPSTGAKPVLRGGSWIWESRTCRISSRGVTDEDGRDDKYGDIGFRLAESLE